MLALYIIIGIVLLIAAILLIPAELGFEYSIIDKEQRMVLYLRILFIPIKIPLRIKKDEEELDKDAKKEEKKLFADMTWKKFWQTVHGIREAYTDTKDEMKELYRYLKKKVTIKQIFLGINFGFSDAAKTGMATGAIWAGGCTVLSIIDDVFGIGELEMNVYPDFTKQVFKIRLKSIFKAQLVYIINIVIKALYIVNTFVTTIEKGITSQNKNTDKKEKAVHGNGRTSD